MQVTELKSLIASRFCNLDGCGSMLERISQDQLLRLHGFLKENKVNLLMLAPIMDTALNIHSRRLPAEFKLTKEAGVSPNHTHPSAPEQAGEVGTNQPGEPDRIFPAPLGAFGFGLTLGTWYQEKETAFKDTPFPQEKELGDFLDYAHAAEFLPGDFSFIIECAAMTPGFLVLKLRKLAPELGEVLQSATIFGSQFGHEPWEAEGYAVEFLFCLGLVASGLGVPVAAEEELPFLIPEAP